VVRIRKKASFPKGEAGSLIDLMYSVGKARGEGVVAVLAKAGLLGHDVCSTRAAPSMEARRMVCRSTGLSPLVPGLSPC
jgi:hypothetical protein